MMMNKKRSKKLELSKYAFLLPVIIFFASAFTVSKADGTIVEIVERAKETDLLEPMQVKVDTVPPGRLSDEAEQDTIKLRTEGRASKEEVLNGSAVQDIIVSGYRSDNLDGHRKQLGKAQQSINGRGVKIAAKAKGLTNFRMGSSNEQRPLFLVDGEEKYSDFELGSIDPNDIASISVLKDGSAITLYGDKGKHGVILIETKANYVGKDSAAVKKRLYTAVQKSLYSNKDSLLIVEKGVPSVFDTVNIEKRFAVLGSKGEALVNITDDDVLLVDGKPVSKNYFKRAVRKKKGSVLVEGKDKGRVLNVISKD